MVFFSFRSFVSTLYPFYLRGSCIFPYKQTMCNTFINPLCESLNNHAPHWPNFPSPTSHGGTAVSATDSVSACRIGGSGLNSRGHSLTRASILSGSGKWAATSAQLGNHCETMRRCLSHSGSTPPAGSRPLQQWRTLQQGSIGFVLQSTLHFAYPPSKICPSAKIWSQQDLLESGW